jgi:hypothetical protein
MKFKIKTSGLLNAGLFFFIILFSIWSNPSLVPYENGDSIGYINVANDFSDRSSNDLRSFGYPLIIKLAMIIDKDNWKKSLVLIQIILHAFSILILKKGFIKIEISNRLSFIISLIIGIHPGLLVYTNYLIAESFLGFLLILYWYLGISIIQNKNKNILINITLMGLISSLSYMVKAVWILGFVTFIIPIFLISKSKNKIIIVLFLFSTMHFSLPFMWENFKFKKSENNKSLRYQSLVVNINMAAIRLGLIETGKGTELYQRVKSFGFLEDARKCNGDDNINFRNIYHGIDFMDRYDIEFTKKIIYNKLPPFLLGQLKNIYRIYYDRTHQPGYEKFNLMPHTVKYIYYASFNFFYRPILMILMLTGLVFNLLNKKQKELIIFNYSILIYFSLVLSIFTIAPVHMIRMRTPIEFLIILNSFIPFMNYMKNSNFFSDYKIFKYV